MQGLLGPIAERRNIRNPDHQAALMKLEQSAPSLAGSSVAQST
jgi:hypothetical protein